MIIKMRGSQEEITCIDHMPEYMRREVSEAWKDYVMRRGHDSTKTITYKVRTDASPSQKITVYMQGRRGRNNGRCMGRNWYFGRI